MRNYLILSFIMCLFSLGVISQTQEAEAFSGPRFQYESENNILDLGTFYVDALEPFDFQVKFSNTGNEPLVVSNVRGCCGTQIPNWTKEPVMPGDTGTIDVKFRLAPRPQVMNRTVTASTNDPENTKILRMRLQVIERSEE